MIDMTGDIPLVGPFVLSHERVMAVISTLAIVIGLTGYGAVEGVSRMSGRHYSRGYDLLALILSLLLVDFTHVPQAHIQSVKRLRCLELSVSDTAQIRTLDHDLRSFSKNS
jgi:hypothetical protein